MKILSWQLMINLFYRTMKDFEMIRGMKMKLNPQNSVSDHAEFLFLFTIYLSPWVLVEARGALSAHWLGCSVPRGIFVPKPGIKPTCPTLAGRFPTTGSPGKSRGTFIISSLLAEGSVSWRWEPCSRSALSPRPWLRLSSFSPGDSCA